MKTSDTRPAKTAAVIVLVCAVGCVASTIAALATMGVIYGIPPEAGDVLTYLYQINAIFCLFAAVFAIDVLFLKRHRSVLAKCMCWGMLILSVMYITPFVTDTLSYLGSMSFLPAFRYACAYLPFFTLIAALIAALTTWGAPEHRSASIVSMCCSLGGVFCGVVYLWQVAPALADTSTAFDTAQIWAIIAGYVTAIAIPIALWFATLTEETWLSFMTAKSGPDACVTAEAMRREVKGRADLEEAIRAELEEVSIAPLGDENNRANGSVGTGSGLSESAATDAATGVADAPDTKADAGHAANDAAQGADSNAAGDSATSTAEKSQKTEVTGAANDVTAAADAKADADDSADLAKSAPSGDDAAANSAKEDSASSSSDVS